MDSLKTLYKLISVLDKYKISYLLKPNLKMYSSWKIGHTADILIEAVSIDEIIHINSISNLLKIPIKVIGDGTNILFPDYHIDGIILRFSKKFSGIKKIDNNEFEIRSGTWTPYVANYIGNRGFTGIEHIIGIPGTFGGLIYMNGGSLRNSISSSIKSVRVFDGKKCIDLQNDECKFDYRNSIFQSKKYIIISAKLKLKKANRTEVIKSMEKILNDRRFKIPRKFPNCGSVFISDPVLYKEFGSPGKVIDDLGLKGYRVGGAYVSTKHGNFIINDGTATSRNVLELVNYVKDAVLKETGIGLNIEFRIIK